MTFGCNKHHVYLDGTPKMIIKQERGVTRVWEFDLSEMGCIGGEQEGDSKACESSWRVSEA